MTQHRTPQIESALMRAVSTVLTEGLADPRVRGLVTVTGVELTEDHAVAVVKVSVMPAEHERATLAALQHAAPQVRHRVGRRVRYRQLPRLQFKLDPSIKRQARVLDAINQAMAESPPTAAADDDTPPDAPSPNPRDRKDSSP